MPEFRRRQPWRFPAFRPDDPVVQLVWRHADADDEILTALNAVAADTPFVGHSSSLTRCCFRSDAVPARTALPRRQVYKGRLAELERAYHAGHRPSPGADVRGVPPTETGAAKSIFGDRWLVLEHVGGEMPDLRAAALVGKALRYALMSGYKRNGQEAAVPAVVSGHATDGSPASVRRARGRDHGVGTRCVRKYRASRTNANFYRQAFGCAGRSIGLSIRSGTTLDGLALARKPR
jgi:CRISPR-associated protein Csb2